MSTQSPFEFHTGMFFRQIKGHPEPVDKWQWQGHCPFCKKPDHFFYGNTYGWDCKHCQKKGNLYDFIRHVHQELCTTELIPVFAMQRGIDMQYITRNKVKWNPLNQSIVIPTFNSKGNMNYLYKLVQIEGKWRVYNMPSLEATLFNWPEKIHQTVWLCEGLTDKMAAEEIIGIRQITPIGIPGSNFKQTWTGALSGKDVAILTDNDEAGDNIYEQIMAKIKTATNKPNSVKRIKWTPDKRPKYDVNNVLNDHKVDSYTYITNNLIDCELTEGQATSTFDVIPDPSCKTFLDLRASCKEYYHYTSDMDLLLLLMATSIYALKFDGEQLWPRVIAPPGSFKSTACKIIGSSIWTVLQSTFTGLFSGFSDDDPSDASLVPIIAGKALIVKDADALLQQPNREQIFSQIRDFYDKSSSIFYLNRRSYRYDNIRSCFMLCGTHALRGLDDTSLGERFIDFCLHVTEEDRDAIARVCSRRANNMGLEGSTSEDHIFRKAKNLIDNELMNQNDIVRLRDDDLGWIEEQCKLVAYMRAKVNRKPNGEVHYKPYAETPSRIVGQLVKVGNCAPVILQQKDFCDTSHKLVSKLAADIMDTESLRFQIGRIMTVAGHQSLGKLVDFIGNVSPKTVERELDDMRLLNMLDIKQVALGTNTKMPIAALKPNLASQMKLVLETTTQHGNE